MRRISVTSLVYTSTTFFTRRYSLRRGTIIEKDKSPSGEVLKDDSSSDTRPKLPERIGGLDKSPDHLVQIETEFPIWYYYKTTTV